MVREWRGGVFGNRGDMASCGPNTAIAGRSYGRYKGQDAGPASRLADGILSSVETTECKRLQKYNRILD